MLQNIKIRYLLSQNVKIRAMSRKNGIDCAVSWLCILCCSDAYDDNEDDDIYDNDQDDDYSDDNDNIDRDDDDDNDNDDDKFTFAILNESLCAVGR